MCGRLLALQDRLSLKKKSNAAAALRNIIAEYITPAGLKIGSIRTDEGGEFEGEFQQVLDSHGITHEFTPPHTPQYNGVAERVANPSRGQLNRENGCFPVRVCA